jgi:hypothetical protein
VMLQNVSWHILLSSADIHMEYLSSPFPLIW